METKDIDFILVSSSARQENEYEESLEKKRSIFEENLAAQGLQMEKETYGCLTFVKLHAPEPVLKRYCEIMQFRMPIKKFPRAYHKSSVFEKMNVVKRIVKMMKIIGNYLTGGDLTQMAQSNTDEFLATYSREKAYLFDEENENFFTSTIRILIVHYILNRQTLDGENLVGLEELISDNIYIAAYPLHEGDYEDQNNKRGRLFENWAQLRNWNKNQPLDLIQEYLGTKVAFYFSWLEFYTRLLIPASFCGALVFLYGYITLGDDHVSQDTCNSHNVTMCPTCDYACDYYYLSDNCWYSKITYLFDNSFTAWFALLMSIWASTFFEIWKRHAAVLTHRWGMIEYSVAEESPRPEYIAKVNRYDKFKINKVTEKKERVLPLWRVKIPVRILSYTTIIFFIMLVVIAVVAIMMYKIWISTVLNTVTVTDSDTSFLKTYKSFIVSGTSVSLNLISIMALNVVYSKVATYLTELECHRTLTEHETALTIKIYIFQFINYYSSIMYIAFFKGKFIGYPKEYLKVFGYRQEECNYGGCLLELSIQLAFIMIGKQIFGAIFEMSVPAMRTLFNKHQSKSEKSDLNISLSTELNDLAKAPPNLRWVEDFKLLDWETVGLFSEYLEMVIQFGFITLFVPAFPLAPLFAFLNNKFEIHLDARKILTYYRRPIPHRVPGIGVWLQILQFVGGLAVLTNAIVIAFSSSFVPKLVYFLNYGTNENFLNKSLSLMKVDDIVPNTRLLNSKHGNVSYCSYSDFREPPWSSKAYEPIPLYWQIFIARLVFIILFQNITYAIKNVIDYWIHDEPEELKRLIKKENYLTTQLIIEHETKLMVKTNENSYDKKDDTDDEIESSSSMQLLEYTLDIGVKKMATHSKTDT